MRVQRAAEIEPLITSSCVRLHLSRYEARVESTKEALGMLEAQNKIGLMEIFLQRHKVYLRFIHCIENLNTFAFISKWVYSHCGLFLTVVKCVFFPSDRSRCLFSLLL